MLSKEPRSLESRISDYRQLQWSIAQNNYDTPSPTSQIIQSKSVNKLTSGMRGPTSEPLDTRRLQQIPLIRGSVLVPSVTSAFERIPRRVDIEESRDLLRHDIRGVGAPCQNGGRRQRTRDTLSLPRGMPQDKNSFKYKSMDEFSQQRADRLNVRYGNTLQRSPDVETTTMSRFLSTFKDEYVQSSRQLLHRDGDSGVSNSCRLSGVFGITDNDDQVATNHSANLLSPDTNLTNLHVDHHRSTPSSPCKLLLDIVRESHFSAFRYKSPTNETIQSSPRDTQESTPVSPTTSTSGITLTSPMTSPVRCTTCASIQLQYLRPKAQSPHVRDVDDTPSSKKVYQELALPAPVNKTLLKPTTIVSQNNSPRPIHTSSTHSAGSAPSGVGHRQLTNGFNEPDDHQLSKLSTTPCLKLNDCSEEFNAVTDALDSAIARLTTNVSVKPAVSVTVNSQERAPLRSSNTFQQLAEDGNGDESPCSNDECSETSGSSDTGARDRIPSDPGLRANKFRDGPGSKGNKARAHVRYKKLSAEVQVIQNHRKTQMSKIDSFDRCDSDSSANQSALPLPRNSIIKRHRDRKLRSMPRCTPSSASSSSSSSSSLTGTSADSRCDVDIQLFKTESLERLNYFPERRNRKHHQLRDISPAVNIDVTALDWRTANT